MLHLSSAAKCVLLLVEMLPVFPSCLTVQVPSHHWVPPCQSNTAAMNEVTLGYSGVYSNENVRNGIIQAMEQAKVIQKSYLEWLVLLSCLGKLLFLHLHTKNAILICL